MSDDLHKDLAGVREPGVFIVDDVAFIQSKHGMAIGEAIARRGIKKQYYLETRGDVLLRNKEVFQFWKTLGLAYMFIGIEAIDAEGLAHYRKRTTMGKNFEALEFARSLGITVAINLIADPSWDRRRFEIVRQWCLEIPEIVNISVNTPYPGTETWHTEARQVTTRDYRLYDIQHAVLPTTLPLPEFYAELVKTQQILNQKHLGWSALKSTARIAAGHLLRGQTEAARHTAAELLGSAVRLTGVMPSALGMLQAQMARVAEDLRAVSVYGEGGALEAAANDVV